MYALQQLPSTCYQTTVTFTSTPDASAFITFDPTARSFQIQTANNAHTGIYQVTVTATIPFETSPGVKISDEFIFQITVLDSCDTTTLNFDPVVTNMLAYVNLAANYQTVLATDTSSTSYGNGDGFTLCGSRSYTISPTTYPFLTISGDVLTLDSTDRTEATTSPITISISATLDDYPSIPAVSQLFQFEIIDHCDNTVLSFNPVVTDMLAYVKLGADSQIVLATDSASTTYGNGDGFTFCGPRTYAILPTTYPFLTISGDVLTLESADRTEATASPITISISATLDDYASILAVSQSFQIEIIDRCDTTVLSFNPVVTNMLAYVDMAADTQTKLATDSASTTYGNGDGFTLCGPRTYTITTTAYPFLTLSGDVLTLESTDPSDTTNAPLTITIEAKLDNYLAVSPATQTFQVEIICEVISLSWSTLLPATYSHVLLVDSIPAMIPFAVVQSPLCGTALTYELTHASGTPTPWISAASGTDLQLSPDSLSLEGIHDFQLTARDPKTSLTSVIASIQITLEHPCETTAVFATGIPDQNVFFWQFTNDPNLMSFSVPYTEFETEVTTTLGVSCGQFTYTVALAVLEPDDPAIISNMSVDPVEQTMDIDLVKESVPNGLIATLSLTGTLQLYPGIVHQQTFQLKVYQFGCADSQDTYEYQIGDALQTIEVQLSQAPDYQIGREISINATNLSSGDQVASPSFISLLGAPVAPPDSSEQVFTLQVFSTDNKVASATYRVDLVVQYLQYPLAQRHCSIYLEITAQSFVWDEDEFSRHQIPKFDEEEASGRYEPQDGTQALEAEPFLAVCAENRSTDEEWSIELPKIVGEEDSNKKVTIKVDLGKSQEIFQYNPYQRKFTMKEHNGGTRKQEVYYVWITLFNEHQSSTRYRMTIIYECRSVELDNQIQSYVYQWTSKPPVPYIDNIDQKGLVTVKFNTTMVPEAALNETLLEAQNLGQLKRQLQDERVTIQGRRVSDFERFTLINNGTIKIENTTYPSVDVHVVPFDSDDFCSDSLNFTWECTDYEVDQLLIQLAFDRPECVSAETNIGDSLEITFNDQRLFKDKVGSMIPLRWKTSHSLPRQARDEIDLKISQTAGEIMMTGAAVTTVAVIISLSCSVGFFASLALKRFLDAFKTLQIIVHIMLIDLLAVAHCEAFFKFIMKITNLQLFDPSDTMIETLPVQKSDAINIHFEEAGYEYSDSVLSMGCVIVIIMASPILVIILLLARYIFCCQRVKNFFKKQLEETIFNRAILFLDSQILVVTTCACINIYQVNRKVIDPSFSYNVAIVSLGLVAVGLISLFTYLFAKSSQLESQAVKNRVGAIYSGYVVHRDAKKALVTLFCQIGRRIMLGAVITFGEGNHLVQFLSIHFSSLLLLTLVGFMRPLETRSAHQIELISEFFIVTLFSILLSHAGLVGSSDVRYYIGWLVVCTVSLQMFLTFGNVLRIAIFGIIHKIKIYMLKKQFQKKQVEHRKQLAINQYRLKQIGIYNKSQEQEGKSQSGSLAVTITMKSKQKKVLGHKNGLSIVEETSHVLKVKSPIRQEENPLPKTTPMNMNRNFKTPRKNLKIKRQSAQKSTSLLLPQTPQTARNDMDDQNCTFITPALNEESKKIVGSLNEMNKCREPPSRAPIKMPDESIENIKARMSNNLGVLLSSKLPISQTEVQQVTRNHDTFQPKPVKKARNQVKVTPEMIKVLYEAESAKLEDPSYPGGGFNPPYGPSLNPNKYTYNRYAYQELLQVEWMRLTIDQLFK